VASVSTDRNGRRRILFVDKNGKRRALHLGKVAKKLADEIRGRVEKLNTARITGSAVEEETARWVAGRGAVLASRLAGLGLIAKRVDVRPLGDFLDTYIAGRTDHKPNTTKTLDQARQRLVAYFDAKRPLDDITAADAENWRNDLRLQGYKPATIATHVKRAKQMIQSAVDTGMLSHNPFAKLKAGQQTDKSREEFISQATIYSVIEAAPDVDWRLIVALARFGGLRCPSEVLALEWRFIDWARDRFTVFSPKCEHLRNGGTRVVPIFRELRPYLTEAFEQAKPGEVHVISRYRGTCKNLRTQFERILRKAGVPPWERLFHNLRSSRQTELTEVFPAHVVASWLGNSVRVATQHYLQTTEEHFQRGAQYGAQVAQNPTQQAAALGGTDLYESTQASPDSGLCETVLIETKACGLGEYPRQESNL